MTPDRHYDISPRSACWTHLTLKVVDLDRSIEWYEVNTPLEVLRRFTDNYGVGVWLADPGMGDSPFVLVLSQFVPEMDPFGFAPPTVLGPYAHLGFELTSREEVEEIAVRAEQEGSLVYPITQMPPPIGLICFVEDPDGNTVEFSFDQGTYAIWDEEWGDAT
jgi:catechol 2,3-dioxygenase-like lactoylglutathione lyase family enzyme